jgi:hypothetical protein
MGENSQPSERKELGKVLNDQRKKKKRIRQPRPEAMNETKDMAMHGFRKQQSIKFPEFQQIEKKKTPAAAGQNDQARSKPPHRISFHTVILPRLRGLAISTANSSSARLPLSLPFLSRRNSHKYTLSTGSQHRVDVT